MPSKQGVVEFFNPQGKKVGRGSVVYSFKLDDGEWYNCNFDRPDVEQGDSVRFHYEDGKYGREIKDIKTIQVKKNPNSSVGGPVKAGGMSKNQYWEKREERDIENQKRISYSGCLNTAIAFTEKAATLAHMPMAATALGKKGGDKLLLEYVYTMADELYNRVHTRPFELDAVVPEEDQSKEDLKALEQEANSAAGRGDGWDDSDDWGDK